MRVDESLDEAVRAAFGRDANAAMAILMSHGDQQSGRETDRVRRAVLRLSEGDLTRLRHFSASAAQDYRDVLMWAENPPEADEPRTYAELRERLGLPPDPDHS